MLKNMLALIVAILLLSGCTNADSSGQPGPDAEVSGGPGGTGTELALGARDPATESPSATGGSSADPASAGASPDASADAFSPTLTIYDTQTGEYRTVHAPESAVVRLAHDASANRYAVAFLTDGGFRLYFPDEDKWQDVPLAFRQPGASGAGEREVALPAPQDEAAGRMLPLRLSPLYTGDQWFYLSRNNEIFRLNADTGIAERIWSAPENRAVYGMSASPDGTRLALLLSREGLGSEVDAVVVDAANGSVLHERQNAVYTAKSDGFLAHLEIGWIDDVTIGAETSTKITEGHETVWKRGWLTWRTDSGRAELRTVPGSRFRYSTDLSRIAVETGETRAIVLLDDSRAGTVIDDVLSVDGQLLPAGELSTENGRQLGAGILLGWMHDRHVVWYQNENLQTIEDVFH